MTAALQIITRRWARTINFGWRYRELPARSVAGASFILLLLLTLAFWQGVRTAREARRLSGQLTKIQAARDASIVGVGVAEAPDLVQTLPSAPAVTQVMQTLQQAADKEGAHVLSLQAEDHAATPGTLGHLDLIISIKAPYPSIVVVIQQVLDRYPGATLRQLHLAHTVAPASTMPIVVAPSIGPTALPAMTESEAHVTLAFWRRPLGVQAALPIDGDATAPVALASSAPTIAATAGTSATALPPLAPKVSIVRAASGTK